jgi:hypothetical protein
MLDASDDVLDDFWLHGTDNGCSPGNMHWCSNFRPFLPKEVIWAAGEPKSSGGCVYMKSSNASSLATANCSTEMRFLCDVRKKGTSGMSMQQECLETWDVTAGDYRLLYLYQVTIQIPEELDALTNTSVDVKTLGLHVKVCSVVLIIIFVT